MKRWIQRMIVLGLGLSLFSLHTSPAYAANACQSNGTGGGNFNVVATWTSCGGTTPQAADSITILNGDTVTLVATTSVTGITINTGGILDADARALTDSGGYTNNGSHIGTTSTMALTGSGATIDGNGSYTPTGIVTMNTGSKTIASGSALSFPSVTITGVTVTNNSTAGFTVTTALAGTGELAQGSSAIVNIGGTSAITTLTATASGNTVKYNGGAAQTLKGTTYENLIIASGNTVTNSAADAVIQSTGSLSILSGTLNLSTRNFTNNGTTTVTGTLSDSSATGTNIFVGLITVNGTWTSAGNSAYTLRGGISNNGSFTSGSGIYTFDTNAQIIDGSNAISISSVTITGITATNTNTVGFTIGTAVAGTGTLAQGTNAILNLGGTVDAITFDASASPNEVHYTSTAANQNIVAGTYHHLFIEKSGRVGTLLGAVTVNGNLTVTAGTLADGGFQITGNVTGTLTLSASTTLTLGTAATATSFPTAFTNGHSSLATSSTVSYSANVAQTISNTPTYGNITTATTIATGTVTKTAAGAFTVNGSFTNGASNSFADGGFTITLKDGATMTGSHTGSGKILFTGGSATHSVSGTYSNVELDDANGVLLSGTTTINGTLTITSGTFDTDARTVVVVGATTVNGGTLSISSTTLTKTFGDITIASGAAMSFTAVEAVTINGNLIVNGTGVISGTTGILTFQKVGGGTIGGTAPSLTIAGQATFATAYVLPTTFTVNTLSVSTGITETNTGTVTVNTALSGAGTFTQGANTVLNLGGTATIATLDASVNPNDVHYTSTTASQTVKTATYYNLFLDKPGRTGTMSGVTNILGNFVSTADTTDFITSTVTITGTTDIYGILKDQNNTGLVTFGGLLTMHSGSSWFGNPAEACLFTFHNGMQYDGGSFVSGSGNFTFDTNPQSITGSGAVTISNIVVTGVQLTNSNSSSVTVATSLSGTGEFIQGANAVLNIASTSGITSLTASASGNTVNYTGTAAQTVHASTYQTLDVSGNTNGSVDITADTTTNTVLTLGATKMTTAANRMIISSGATLSRTTGFIIGNLEKDAATGATSRTFEVGTGSDYTPIDISFGNVTVAGNLVATASASDDPSIATSGLFASRTVNRFWTVTNIGASFDSYGATFTFVPADVDAGASTSFFILKKLDSGIWTRTTRVAANPTSLQASGMTSFSQYQIGEQPITNVTSTLPDGTYPIGQVIPIQVSFADTVFVTGTPLLLLNSGGTASYVSGSGTTTLTFNYTVGSGDSASDLDYASTTALTVSGGTIQDVTLADLDLTLPSPGSAGSLGANKNILVDTTPAPTPTPGGSGGGGGIPGPAPTPTPVPSLPNTGPIPPSTNLTFAEIRAATPPGYAPYRADPFPDHYIDILDFNELMVHWGQVSGDASTGLCNDKILADIDCSGRVDIVDFNLLLVYWGKPIYIKP